MDKNYMELMAQRESQNHLHPPAPAVVGQIRLVDIETVVKSCG